MPEDARGSVSVKAGEVEEPEAAEVVARDLVWKLPEDCAVEQGVLELEDARDGIEFEAEERGPNVAGMFVFPPLESRGKDSNGGSDSARAL